MILGLVSHGKEPQTYPQSQKEMCGDSEKVSGQTKCNKHFRSEGYDCDHTIHPQKTEFQKVRWDPLKPNRLWPRTKMGKHLKKTSQKQSIPSSMTTNGHVSSLYKKKKCKGGKFRALTLTDCVSQGLVLMAHFKTRLADKQLVSVIPHCAGFQNWSEGKQRWLPF